MLKFRTILLPFCLLLLPCLVNAKKIHFTTEIADDATLAVVKTILAVEEEGISQISFEKGTYHFYPDKAFEIYRHISNHDN